MAITRLDHVQLACPPGGEPEARRFYVGLLGFEEVPKPPLLAVRGGCWFRSGSAEVHLGVESAFVPARKAHPALVADDIDGLAKVLADAGCEVRWSEEVPGVRRFHTDDPFGNRIEIVAGG
jgi:catechol 2,3-dioxygenase-like lactoylglutathione lyase family enzyme